MNSDFTHLTPQDQVVTISVRAHGFYGEKEMRQAFPAWDPARRLETCQESGAAGPLLGQLSSMVGPACISGNLPSAQAHIPIPAHLQKPDAKPPSKEDYFVKLEDLL